MEGGRRLIEIDEYHTPVVCKECGGIMVFKGVGEYQCEDCKALDYDDYGKARLYIETHKGATAHEIELNTGVKQRTIRNMLKEGRLQVSASSKSFLTCELCGKSIRFGRLCQECEVTSHRQFEEQQRQMRKTQMQAYGRVGEDASGARRFKVE